MVSLWGLRPEVVGRKEPIGGLAMGLILVKLWEGVT